MKVAQRHAGNVLSPAMRHVQLVVATASITERPLPLRHGTVQIVERSGGAADGSLDWEVVLHTIEPEPVANASHRLRLDAITGVDRSGQLTSAALTGDAVLVRSVELALVFRGNGPLDGFDPELLA